MWRHVVDQVDDLQGIVKMKGVQEWVGIRKGKFGAHECGGRLLTRLMIGSAQVASPALVVQSRCTHACDMPFGVPSVDALPI